MRLFDEMPLLVLDAAPDACGAGEGVNPRMAYCTTRNEILIWDTTGPSGQMGYELAHLYGHAVQVRHGVADVALREIRKRRDEEQKLRGWVTRQAECIAGVIHSEAGLPDIALSDIFEAEPMTDSHWGRDPLHLGPKVSIGIEARDAWFAIGLRGDIAQCAVGEFESQLLTEALR